MAEFIATNAEILVVIALALVGAGAGYVRLQSRVAEQGRAIAEMKAQDELLHKRISDRGDEYQKLREGQIRLEEQLKFIRETLDKLNHHDGGGSNA